MPIARSRYSFLTNVALGGNAGLMGFGLRLVGTRQQLATGDSSYQRPGAGFESPSAAHHPNQFSSEHAAWRFREEEV